MLTAILATLLVILVVVLSLIIWSIKRHRDPDLHIECDHPIDKLVPSLAGLTLSTAIDGNSVEIFENGAYFDVLIEDIGKARHSVHFETFLWEEGVLAKRIARRAWPSVRRPGCRCACCSTRSARRRWARRSSVR